MIKDLPEGVVTFLFTDVEGSTRLFEEAPEHMLEALRQHDDAIDEVVLAHGGVLVRPRGEGDSRFIVFAEAYYAVAAAAAIQLRLASISWTTPKPILVRAALHTGVADLRSGDYYGSAVNRAARLRSIAHGGQTIMSGSTWELVQDRLPSGTSVKDLGKHSLKDLTRPERVFQLTPDGLPDQFPPLDSLNHISNNLPEQLTDFVGRQFELAEAKRLVSETRLLTLIAPGGTGKTRLAIQTAAEVGERFQDGVFLIGFADISSSEDIIQTIAEALGIALSGDEDVQTQLVNYLAHRRQLLVMDNLEHLDGAAGVIDEILKASPEVCILATSRSKLNLTGETVLALAGLEISWDHPDKVMEASGARLFLEAARRSKPDFELENEDLEALAAILRLVGGMPLGILLAAAWVDMLKVEEIAEEIGKSADFLETALRDLPDRQRSIRAVFNYSWKLLSPEEQQTFAKLSVFRGGFRREAAEAVAGASLRSLASLVGKSLLTANPESGRYEVHELLRQYAVIELERDPEKSRQVRDAHADYFSEMMGRAPFQLANRQQALHLTLVEEDIDNVRSAWRHLITAADAVRARKFIIGLFLLYEYRGWYRASVEMFKEALDALPEDPADQSLMILRALVSVVQAWALTMLSRPEAGVMAADQANEFIARSGELVDYWVSVQCLALGLAYLGSIEKMKIKLDEAIVRYESLDEQFWVCSLKDWRAFAAFLDGDLAAAARYTREAIAGVSSSGEYWVTIWNLWVRAMVATQDNRPLDAIALYTSQLSLCREVAFVRGTMVSMDGLGEANVAARRLAAAEAAFIEGMATAGKMGMICDVLSMMTKIARVRALLGKRVDAVEMLATVLAEPISVQQPFTSNVPINQLASTELAELQAMMDPQEFTAAYARGTERSYDQASRAVLGAKELQ